MVVFGSGGKDGGGPGAWLRSEKVLYLAFGVLLGGYLLGLLLCGDRARPAPGARPAAAPAAPAPEPPADAWSRTFGTPLGQDCLKTACLTSDGGFACAGYLVTRPQGAGDEVGVLAVDPAGGLRWKRGLRGMGKTCWPTDIAPAQDGGVFLSGFTSDIGVLTTFWLARFDASGALLWSRQWEAGDFAEVRRIHPDGEGGVFAAGWQRIGGDQDLWAGRFGPDGALLWQRAFDAGGEEGASALVQAEGGGIWLLATTHAGEDWGTLRSFLLRVAPSGQLLGLQTLSLQGEPLSAFGLSPAPGGGLTLWGRVRGTGAEELDLWAGRVSGALVPLWSVVLATPGIDNLVAGAPAAAGGLTLVSERVVVKRPEPEDEFYLLSLGESGAVTACRAFEGEAYDLGPRAECVLPVEDGGIFLAGARNGDLWVARLRAGGLLAGTTAGEASPYAVRPAALVLTPGAGRWKEGGAKAAESPLAAFDLEPPAVPFRTAIQATAPSR